MAEERVQRRLAAILAADVVGYSRLMGEDEAGTRGRFNDLLDEAVRPAINEHRGRLVKTMGDGFLVEFTSVVDAVQCAADIQAGAAVREEDEAENRRLRLRVGIHLGDVIVEGDDIHGDGVNVAARLEGLAEPGGIYVSDLVQASIRKKLDLDFEDLGDQSLKNIAEPVRVYRVALKAAPSRSATASDAMFLRPAIAVLPFENLSGDPDQEYFADGLTEDIISALSSWKTFPVIARNSSFAYKGQSPDIRKIGDELGARYVIEGSVRKAGDRVRVTAQLINSETGHHVWAERYDRKLADIFELQDELTERITATVAPEVERGERRHAVETRSRNLDVWDLVQRGMAHVDLFDAEGNTSARALFQRALELDPNYVEAFIGIAWSHIRDLNSVGVSDPSASKRQALAAARRAVELNSADSYAHVVLGISCTLNGDIPRAIQEFEMAVELNPNSANGHVSLGHALALSGSADDAIRHLEKGLALNPKDPRNHLYYAFLSRAYLTAHRYEEAEHWARRAVRWNADTPLARTLLVSSLSHQDRVSEARSELEALQRVRPGYMANSENWHLYAEADDEEHFLDGLRKAGWED